MDRQFKIETDISSIDYHGAIEYIKNSMKNCNMLTSAIFKIIDTKTAKNALLHLIQIKKVNRIILNKINEKFQGKLFHAQFETLSVKAEGETMKITLDCNIDDLDDILMFAERKIKLKDENMNSIICSSIKAVKETIPDNVKIELISYVLNDSGDEICRYVSQKISDRFFKIQINNLHFKSELFKSELNVKESFLNN